MTDLPDDPRLPDTGPRRVIVLGSTGSIGTQTLDVIAHVNALHQGGRSPLSFEVVGLAAGGGKTSLLAEQARRFGVRNIACGERIPAGDLPSGARAFSGSTSAEELVRTVECDLVVSAIVGIAGLPATLAAVQEGRHVALANKETLVAAGSLIVPLARDPVYKVCLLPVDSEHAALWQCLLSGVGPFRWEDDPHRHQWCPPWLDVQGLRAVVLTASGGPFRTWPRERISEATPTDALNHPTWRMGPKVTVDSASLMNKALEIIEAHWLFGIAPDRIRVLIHPQSTLHAMAEFDDGSVVAQMAAPDMRTPIQAALTWPCKMEGLARRVELGALRKLEFEEVDDERFPAVGLAYDVIARGGTAGAVLNAANEEAVRAFLDKERWPALPFGRIVEIVGECLDAVGASPVGRLEDVLEADARARTFVLERLSAGTRPPSR